MRRRVGMALAAAWTRRGAHATRSSATGRARRAAHARRRRPSRGAAAGESALGGAAVPAWHAAPRAAGHGSSQRRARQRRPGRLRDRVDLPRRGRRRVAGASAGPSSAERPGVVGAQRSAAVPADACRQPLLCGQREPQGWWGPAVPCRGPMPSTWPARSPTSAGSSVDVATGTDPVFHPGRCAQLTVGGRRRRLGRRTASASHRGLRAAPSGPPPCGSISMPSSAPLREVRRAPVVGTQPLAKEDLAVVVDRSACRSPTCRRRWSARRRRAARVGSAVRRVRGTAGAGGQEVPRVRAAVPRARSHAGRGREPRPLVMRRWRWRRSGAEPPSAPDPPRHRATRRGAQGMRVCVYSVA